MAIIIVPRWGYKRQADTYLRSEWYWRGIVDPETVGGEPGHPPGESNICLTTMGVSGTIIGYDTGLGIGSSKPSTIADGTPLYGFTWEYPTVKGEFLITWGIDGKQQVTDVTRILLTYMGQEAGIAEWDDTAAAYTLIDLDMSANLNTLYDEGEIPPFCFGMYTVPSLFIHYDFAELKTGEKI